MFDRSEDHEIRKAAFDWLTATVVASGEIVPRPVLAEGFRYQGVRVPLLGPQGIFKPKILDVPLSITTAPNGPYDDAFGPEGLRYRYRGRDPEHRDNRGLRFIGQQGIPLVYLHGLMPGRYMPVWPVFIVGDDPAGLTFTVKVDDPAHLRPFWESAGVSMEGSDARREYVTSITRRRLHQSAFRERVLAAYRRQCALCRLRHDELLEAAHIIPDSEPEGEPVVSNGLALCQLHHGAFDRFFLGIRPDYIVEVRRDILLEHDGPTLRHAIQGLHGRRIVVPRKVDWKPSAEALEVRYGRFREVAEAV